ncbi:snaclec rhodocetin subunit delta [Leuresthes tenuis]|uniref:snaclec rhodocetin subunit delta n=1 Tax=Leuresthes tenuis TaxID=355514 RepID=UPI003B50BE78
MIDVGQNKTFWIKFRYDEWEWEDQSCSTFREWSESPDPSHTCVYQSNQNKPKKIIPCKIDDLIGRDKLFSTGRVRIVVVQKNSNWEEALKYCEEHHSRLLCIRDESEQEAVEEWLKYTVENITSLWIGLRQSSVFGFWIWSDRIVNYSKWKNNKQPELPISFQCGVINKDQYTWSDKNCLHQLPFLCEEDILFM